MICSNPMLWLASPWQRPRTDCASKWEGLPCNSAIDVVYRYGDGPRAPSLLGDGQADVPSLSEIYDYWQRDESEQLVIVSPPAAASTDNSGLASSSNNHMTRETRVKSIVDTYSAAKLSL